MPKLPKIYQNKIDKEINNNKKIYYGEALSKKKEDFYHDRREIEQVIDDIFKKPTYSFNTELLIYTKNKIYDTSLIAKTKGQVLTFDNDLIPISEIIKIEKK